MDGISIAQAPKQYQKALRIADVDFEGETKNSGYDGLINTDKEMSEAAKNVSADASTKYSGKSAQQAETYLRQVLGLSTDSIEKAPTKIEKASAGTAVELARSISSGWGKGVTYTTKGNVLTIKGSSSNPDADSINIAKIDTKGSSTLVVTVLSVEGNTVWGNKVLGLSIDDRKLENYDVANVGNFPTPKGKSMSGDHFINGGFSEGEKLKYDISGKTTIYLGAKVLCFEGLNVVLKFDLQ